MSRYVDADALKKDVARLHVLNDEAEIRRAYEYNPHATSTDFEETLASVFDAIDDAPSIDIVRCRECIHCADDWNGNQPMFTCELGRCGESVQPNDFCSYGSRSEKPNNCEHITEDGVTCAKYPACDDCPDNPLNKVKGSERLVKGSERSSE